MEKLMEVNASKSLAVINRAFWINEALQMHLLNQNAQEGSASSFRLGTTLGFP
uniref:Uncharacterized protein n=1 Tax=Anguilla anguilla TaxID=7936 RepID=A0A0E9QIR3_ANGAN